MIASIAKAYVEADLKPAPTEELRGLKFTENMSNLDPATQLPWRRRIRLRIRNWEHKGRNLLLAFLNATLAAFSKEREFLERLDSESFKTSVRKILIIRTGKAIGDVVMSLVLLPECRRFFPSAQVDFLLRDNVSPLFAEGMGADTLLELHPRFLKWPKASWKLLKILRNQQYDLVIACDHPLKSSLTTLGLSLWTGARYRVGFENEESRAFLNVRVTPKKRTPTITNLLRLLSPFGEVNQELLPRLIPSARFTTEVVSLIGMNPKLIVIFVPQHWRKSWSLDAFLRLAAEMTSRHHRVMLAFGPSDERLTNRKVQEWIQKSEGQGEVLSPKELAFFAAILARCRLFISNDCGPYHIAVSVGTPCVAAFQTREAWEDFGYQRAGSLVTVYHPVQEEAERMTLEAALQILNELDTEKCLNRRF